MHLILRADLDGVGKKGDVVDVADGYARNFLLPKGHAIKASKGAEEQAQAMRRSRDIKDAAARGAAEEVATRLVPTTIKLSAKSGPEGRLFGSIGAGGDRHGDRRADGHRHRPQAVGAGRAHQGARHPHRARQAARRRGVPRHHRGRHPLATVARRVGPPHPDPRPARGGARSSVHPRRETAVTLGSPRARPGAVALSTTRPQVSGPVHMLVRSTRLVPPDPPRCPGRLPVVHTRVRGFPPNRARNPQARR